ncbi:MAG: glycosyltransferase family 2 protein [Bacteroidetes bacterium]|nr:glycosyltransferase family 2 protein [Bacteroidota bacterium]
MKLYSEIKKSVIELYYLKSSRTTESKKKKFIRKIFVSGITSIFLLLLIIYSLPKTVLSVSALIEYSIIVSLVIFLLILLVRYFALLIFSYLYLNEYTFKNDKNFNPFVSIIIPVFNEEKILDMTIESLLKLNYSAYEIIIVNDGSNDNTQEIAERLVGYKSGIYNKIKISLINKENNGKSTALNAGIKISRGEFILCMDGDSQLSPNSIIMAVRHFTNPEIGAVAGNVKVLNRGNFLTDLQALEYVEGLNLARSAQSFMKLVNIIPGPIGIFRKKAIENAGYYDSDTFAEDADLTLRILAAGWKIYYEPKSISYTEAPATLQQLLKQRYRWTRGILQSIRKHKKLLVNPTINFGNTFILWMMLFEALIWPVMNLAANAFFIFAALAFGFTSLIFFWWAGLALLDLMTAIYSVAAEKEEFRLVAYAVIYRMVFILIVDVCKVMSTVEEFLGIKMQWGKLERVG